RYLGRRNNFKIRSRNFLLYGSRHLNLPMTRSVLEMPDPGELMPRWDLVVRAGWLGTCEVRANAALRGLTRSCNAKPLKLRRLRHAPVRGAPFRLAHEQRKTRHPVISSRQI